MGAIMTATVVTSRERRSRADSLGRALIARRLRDVIGKRRCRLKVGNPSLESGSYPDVINVTVPVKNRS